MELIENSVSGFTFACQILPQLGKILPHKDFANLRLICKTWNQIIANTSAYYLKEIILNRKSWEATSSFRHENWGCSSGLEFDDCTTEWRNVQIKYASLFSDQYFVRFWNIACSNVTKLCLKNIQVQCSNITVFLQHCHNLKIIIFDENKFVQGKPIQDPDTNDWAIVICEHGESSNKIIIPEPSKPTIENITIKVNYVFPICILDALIVKSQGVLKSFTYTDAKMTKFDRGVYFPSERLVDAKLHELFSGSLNTLKNLTWTNNINGHAMFTSLRATTIDPTLNKKLQLRVLKFSESKPHRFQVTPATQSVFAFIRTQVDSLEELELHQENPAILMSEIPEILSHTINLASLKLTITKAIPEMQLLTLSKLTKLESLKISVSNSLPAVLRTVPTTYIERLPNECLSSLWLSHNSHQLTKYEIDQIIDRYAWPSNLTKLAITPANALNDKNMQHIIQKLPNLSKLMITKSTKLSDCGVTGICRKTMEAMVQFKCSDDSILNLDEEVQKVVQKDSELKLGFNMKSLQHLDYLSFRKCIYLTNTTFLASFYFPKLRFLDISGTDITDLGLIHIAKNCNQLEIIVMVGSCRCTSHGLHACIHFGKKIKKIYVDLIVTNTWVGPDNFKCDYEHPDFVKIISIEKPPTDEFDLHCHFIKTRPSIVQPRPIPHLTPGIHITYNPFLY